MGDAVPSCFQCYVEEPLLGSIPVLGGCLVQLLSACKPKQTIGEDASARGAWYIWDEVPKSSLAEHGYLGSSLEQ